MITDGTDNLLENIKHKKKIKVNFTTCKLPLKKRRKELLHKFSGSLEVIENIGDYGIISIESE